MGQFVQSSEQPIKLNPALQCPGNYMRLTTARFPKSAALQKNTGVPVGAVLTPLAKGDKEVPVVNFGAIGVVRCKKCRAYINPFVTWLENGHRWRCNICGLVNETSSQYFSHLDATGLRADRKQRPELSNGCVEIIAPREYMVRPPSGPCLRVCH